MISELITIVTPAYNSAQFIATAIDSVRQQTIENWEMIIVDDCSTDRTLEIVEEYARLDRRIKLHRLSLRSGAAVARNYAIDKAHGRYIAFIDSDDAWVPQKLEKQVTFMRTKQAVLTYTAYEKMSEKGELSSRVVTVPDSVNYDQLLSGCVIGCLTAMYDTSILGKVFMPLIAKRQDYGLWLKILKQGHVAYGLNESLAYLRIRKGSVSSNKLVAAAYVWKLYREIENLPYWKSVYHFLSYAYHSAIKYSI